MKQVYPVIFTQLKDEKKEIPQPRTLEEIDISKGAFAGEGVGCVSLVDIDFQEYRRKSDNKTVRRNGTLPNDVFGKRKLWI